ncbi:2-isopropylmalate synthase (Alpha-isopropylmalate synthase) (Alpha-IPM synthetase) [Paecilomyces lecythidis]
MQEDFWSHQESSLSPKCIVVPSSAMDVSTAISILTKGDHGDETHRTPFAIKGGGHSPNAGFANIQNGVTIDMDQIAGVSYNEENSIASVGAGAKWLQVYEYLSEYGVTVAGGDNGGVGVGGLLIGGGMSHFSPRVGWACDGVVNFEIVLASGEITNANRSSNPDLYKALKGGTSNFGVITTYDLSAFPQEGIWGGDVIQDISNLDQVLEAFAKIADAPDYDPYASLETAIEFNGSAWTILHELVYTKEVNDTPPIFQPLLAIEPKAKSTLKNTNLTTIANETATPPTNNILLQTATYGVDARLLKSIFDINNATVHELRPRIEGLFEWTLVFEALPSIWLEHSEKSGGNSLGTSPEDGNAFVFYIEAQWNDTTASTSALIQGSAAKVIQQTDRIAQSKALKHDLIYLNYANANQDPLASYGEENLNNLKAVARKYDPKGIFQTQVPGGFKVSKSGI